MKPLLEAISIGNVRTFVLREPKLGLLANSRIFEAELRENMVAEAAYFVAERRGFALNQYLVYVPLAEAVTDKIQRRVY